MEDWPIIMNSYRIYSDYYGIYFIVFNLVVAYFFLNLFTGIMFRYFNESYSKEQKLAPGDKKAPKSGLKKGNQKGDYLKFAKAKSDSQTLYVVMYIFDNSYKEFFSSRITDKNPVIYGYVPKLYKEDCYDNYFY